MFTVHALSEQRELVAPSLQRGRMQEKGGGKTGDLSARGAVAKNHLGGGRRFYHRKDLPHPVRREP
jgi:hypothetical protein